MYSKGFEYEYCRSQIDAALVAECIRDLKRGKASGPDNIGAEHLHFPHPSLVNSANFSARVCSYVLELGFGLGLTIPLVKDKAGNLNDSDNYRAIRRAIAKLKL